jgi:ribosomal protein L12E/L44/L45/RPP1/RPP2
MKSIRLNSATALLIASLCLAFGPAVAADAVFPPGMRVGLTPLVGLSRAKSFVGFETEDQTVKVLVAELPAEAYDEVMAAFKANPAGAGGVKPESIETAAGLAYYTAESAKDGATNVRRYSMIMPGGTFAGYVAVQVPENAAKIYTDDAVRQMFASAVIRKEVPVDEQLGLMPFKISELADFKNVRTLAPGVALILADADETTGFEIAPFMVIGLIGSTPAQPADRDRFAQQAATTIPGVRDARITMSEAIRIDGTPGFETRIDAVSGKDNTAVTVVQWLKFGGSNTLRIIGSAPRDVWPKAFTRFRAVRDGIQPRG